MKTILFKFDAMGAGNDKAIRDIIKLFDRAGVQVVSSDVAKTMTKRAGVSFRSVDFTFADGQRVTLGVKETGDVFEVKINGGVVPLRQQDDHVKTIIEITGMLDRRRSAFQRAMARVRVPIPPSARVSRSTLLAAKTQKRDSLKEAVGLAEQELVELTGSAVT